MGRPKRETHDLLKRAREGDVEAFATVFEEHRQLMYHVAYRMVGHADADDVVMETYLKAWRGLARFQERAALRTWLCRIARNCALDCLRSRGRHRTRQLSWEDPETGREVETIAGPEDTRPDREAQIRELGGQLREAMDKLSDKHRTAMLLREVDGLSYGEIAAATGVTIGTVMSRLFYARKHLRRLLTEATPEIEQIAGGSA